MGGLRLACSACCMYCIINWFNLADEAPEEAPYDIALIRDLCGFDLGDESIADAMAVASLCYLLEAHEMRTMPSPCRP